MSEVNRPIHEQLQMLDADRRRAAGRAFMDYVSKQGLGGMTYYSNILEALPPSTRPALAAHGVPPEVYEGRILGMALSMLPETAPTVVIGEPLMEAEVNFWRRVADAAEIPFPEIVSHISHVPDDHFMHPFIGSAEGEERFPDRTIPNSIQFNDKAVMRKLVREIGAEEDLVPGAEIFYTGQPMVQYREEIEAKIRECSAQSGKRVWVKHGNTASGLLTTRYDPDFLAQPESHDLIQADLRQMFEVPGTNEVIPANVIIEDQIDFGKEKNGVGDYGIRGVISPDGEFHLFSVGRVISNEKGEFVGMILAPLHRPDLLQKIGLHPDTLKRAGGRLQQLAKVMYANGYFGPVNVDYFALQNNPNSHVLMRDFNMREGGSSGSSLVSAVSDKLWGEYTSVLDVEVNIESDRRFTEDELQALAAKMIEQDVIPYATTFMRHPSRKGDRKWKYTIKTMSPHASPALTDPQAVQSVYGLVDKLNRTIPLGRAKFASSL